MKINIDSAILEYDDNVLYVRVLDDLVLDKNDMELLLQTAVEITGKKNITQSSTQLVVQRPPWKQEIITLPAIIRNTDMQMRLW